MRVVWVPPRYAARPALLSRRRSLAHSGRATAWPTTSENARCCCCSTTSSRWSTPRPSSSALLAEPVPTLQLLVDEPRAASRPGRGRSTRCRRLRNARRSSSSARARRLEPSTEIARALPKRWTAFPSRWSWPPHGTRALTPQADPRSALQTARPPEGRPRRRSAAADPAGHDRVVLRSPRLR